MALPQYQLATPNLPGTVRATDSWIHLSQFGFKKGSKTVESPNRLNALSPYESNQLEPIDKMERSQSRNRPSTAGPSIGGRATDLHGSNQNFNFHAQTAVMESNGRQSLQRPKTASGSLGRSVSSAEVPKSLLGPGGASRGIASPAPFVPKFVETDKLVARFHAHFTQPRAWDEECPIGNPTIETVIGRRVTVLYYISNDTVEIIEEKSQNTGFQGGNFFKRGKLNQANGRPVTLRDLAVGNDVHCLGVTLHITDADPFTREYFRRELRLILGPALPRPEIVREDLGAQYATGLGVKGPVRDRDSYGTCSTDYLMRRVGLDKTNQFLRYEGKVLRFVCYEVPRSDPLVDKSTVENFIPTSSMRRYILLYSLSDNKIEVRALKGAGEEAKILLKRNKLPMNWREVQRGQPPIYYEAYHFKCGSLVDMYGRVFLLTSCDEFTRLTLEELGVEQIEVPVVQEEIESISHPIPALGDGFLPIGSPEDTLATVYGMPKAIRSSKTVLRHQNRLLRARVRQLTRNKIDSSRSFQLSFFLEDNTLQIFEEVTRNSGIVGGNFLKRGRYTNQSPPMNEAPRYFKPTDIFLGNIISLNGLEFQIIEMDNMSLLFCEACPEEFPMFDTFFIVHTLVQKAITNGIDIRKVFSQFDPTHSGSVTRDKFVEVLDKIDLSRHLNDQELLTLVRRFKEGDQYVYIEMADLFSHMFFLNNVRMHRAFIPAEIVDLPTLFVCARSRSTQWRRVLRKDPLTTHGKIRLTHLFQVFRKHGLVVPSHLRGALYSAFGLRGAGATAAHRALLEVAETAKSVTVQHQPARPDVRSRIRAETSLGSVSMTGSVAEEGSDDANWGAAPKKHNKNRRESFSKVTSIMRPYERAPKGRDTHDESDENLWVVDYMTLCDQIYVCDWIKE